MSRADEAQQREIAELREALGKISDHETSAPCRTSEEAVLRTLTEMQAMAIAALNTPSQEGEKR